MIALRGEPPEPGGFCSLLGGESGVSSDETRKRALSGSNPSRRALGGVKADVI